LGGGRLGNAHYVLSRSVEDLWPCEKRAEIAIETCTL
jgi:hypothetical protein